MLHLKAIRKFLKHILILLLVQSVIISFSALIHVYGPREYIYYDDSWETVEPYIPETNITYNILLDQHTHSTYSDGFLSIRQNIEWHIAVGFTALVISDHNTLSNSEEIQQLADEYKDEIIVLQGMEWTTRRLHMNLIGINEWSLEIPSTPTDLEIQQTIAEVHRQNGVVTANHLPAMIKYGDVDVPTRSELIYWGIDFIEIINGHVFDYESFELYIENDKSFGLITGTDMHSPQVNNGGRVYAWTTINASSFTKEAVMTELKAHNTYFITNPYGIVADGVFDKSLVYATFRPFYQLGLSLEHYFYQYDDSKTGAVIAFFVYSFGLFTLFEIAVIFRDMVMYKKEKNIDKQ